MDRINRRWRDLLSLARLFLSDRQQQTSAGTIDGPALLFESNVLFEACIDRIVSRAPAGTTCRASSQGPPAGRDGRRAWPPASRNKVSARRWAG
ncbi:MAG: hypothetical protein ACFBRM_00455 [Pikeienuella sp.]